MFKIGEKVVHIETKQEGKVVRVFEDTDLHTFYAVDIGAREFIYGFKSEFRKKDEPEYRIEVDYADNVIIVKLCDDEGNEVARGHGYIIHEGALGIAQATSYASKRILADLDEKRPVGKKVYAKGTNKYGFNTV